MVTTVGVIRVYCSNDLYHTFFLTTDKYFNTACDILRSWQVVLIFKFAQKNIFQTQYKYVD